MHWRWNQEIFSRLHTNYWQVIHRVVCNIKKEQETNMMQQNSYDSCGILEVRGLFNSRALHISNRYGTHAHTSTMECNSFYDIPNACIMRLFGSQRNAEEFDEFDREKQTSFATSQSMVLFMSHNLWSLCTYRHDSGRESTLYVHCI